jgi:CBS domain-containing protein
MNLLPDEGAVGLNVRDVMTADVVTIDDDATLDEAVDAMAEHRLHAVLVVGSQTGTPLGWVTTRGLLGLVDADGSMPATDAITEEARAIEPSAGLRAAVYALALPGAARLIVRCRGEQAIEGVLSEYDLTVKAMRLAGLSRHPG